MEPFKPENENLFRGLPQACNLRDDVTVGGDEDGTSGTVDERDSLMFGHFTLWDTWYEIDSWYEGTFLERTVKGSLRKTIRENLAQIKVQFDHGYDEFVGAAPLGPIDVLREDDTGAYYEVPLLDTDYNRDRVLPQLQGRLISGERRGSVLGSSFRFRVIKDEWNMEPKPSAYNPKGLPERTILEMRLFEFGPVVFPANPAATSMAGARSLTDYFLERRRSARSAAHLIAPSAAHGTGDVAPNEPPTALGGQTAKTQGMSRSKRVALALAT